MSIRSNLARVFAVIGMGAIALTGCDNDLPVEKKLKKNTIERMEVKQKYGVDPCEVYGETRNQYGWDKWLCPGDLPNEKGVEKKETNTPSKSHSDEEWDYEGEIRHTNGEKLKKRGRGGYKVVPDSNPKKQTGHNKIKPLSPAIQDCISRGDCGFASRPKGSHRKC